MSESETPPEDNSSPGVAQGPTSDEASGRGVSEEEVLEEHQPGPEESSVLSQLQNWKDLTLEQRGPDGTEVLFLIYFYVCPICFAMVPADYEGQSFKGQHSEFHLRQARDLDALNKVVDILKSLVPKEDLDG